MFDANMRHLPAGVDFFAVVYSCGKESALHPLGIKTGDVILCKMLDDDPEDPQINIYIDNKVITYRCSNDEEFMAVWLVYAGRKDLTGFISNSDLKKAKKLLEYTNET